MQISQKTQLQANKKIYSTDQFHCNEKISIMPRNLSP